MFTGLIEERGAVGAVDATGGVTRIAVECSLVRDGLGVGDSVAVNGACLTVVELTASGFAVECVAETIARTALGGLRPGDPVNLERAMRVGDRLDGHIVQGHVDATGTVRAVTPEGDGARLHVDAPPGVLRYVVEKGSITVDGVSLTVASREAEGFTVALIPHTMQVTTLGPSAVGRSVNLEADVLAKYVEALAKPYRPEGGV